MKILLVEDDDVLVNVLMKSLEAHHYTVDAVNDGETGWIYASTFDYDLIIMDITLPKVDGINLSKQLRAEGYTTPILLLTAQDSTKTKVQGLDAGADDYVVKPFVYDELIARIRALLRRGNSQPFSVLACGDLSLNLNTSEMTYKGQPLVLTSMEYELLELLLQDSQHVFSPEEILDRLWSSDEFPSEATVRSHIRRIRRKLVELGAPRDFIATVHGRGYYLKPPTEQKPAILSTDTTSRESVTRVALSSSSSLDSGETAPAQQGHLTLPSTPPTATPTMVQQHDQQAQQQYVDFLNQTWTTTQTKSLEQVKVLSKLVRDLAANRLQAEQREEAKQIAHKLAGTLGIFGLTKSVQTARQLEYCLGELEPLQPQHGSWLKLLIADLTQEIRTTKRIDLSSITQHRSPLLLIANADPALVQAIAPLAIKHGFQIALDPAIQGMASATDTTAPSMNEWMGAIADLHPQWLDSSIPDCSIVDRVAEGASPDVILFQARLRTTSGGADRAVSSTAANPSQYWDALHCLSQQYPNVPIVVVAEQANLGDRLMTIRQGGKLFLDASTSPEQVITMITRWLGRSQTTSNVMVLDDDLVLLQTLPTLLQPWGFNVTTLANPQDCLKMLQTVTPDVLILDVNMPEVNGFELCQVLRSDPRWQRLPILFLSVLTDATSQNHAFQVGADDYVCKPVEGDELAHRILNRLQRVRAWAS